MATIEEVADDMYKMVKSAEGMKKLKAPDLHKAMIEKHGVDKQICKKAIRELVDSGRLVYSYFGGSFLEIPKKED